MAARDLVPFALRPAIKRGVAFDRFADLGEHRARPLLGPGPLKQQRHPALCFLAGISRGEPFVGAERLRQATPGFENACREQIGFSGVEIRRARQYRQQRAVRKPVPRMPPKKDIIISLMYLIDDQRYSWHVCPGGASAGAVAQRSPPRT